MKSLFAFLLCLCTANLLGQSSDSTQCPVLQCTDDGVKIGTDSLPSGYKLAIGGRVIMENGRVDVDSEWPDYVFEKNYSFMNMAELKKYIQVNGHLPNMLDATTVKAEGLDVAEINVLLMQKIEELSLHIIQLQERINKLKVEQEKSNTENKK